MSLPDVLSGLPAIRELLRQAGNPDGAFWTPDREIRG